ncbi:MAG: HYR domain-containing protein, partial [Bacteroidota bacterium]
TVDPSGGTPPYSYQWSNGSTDRTAYGLEAGSYDVLITDTNGCTFELTGIIVEEPDDPVTAEISQYTNPDCQGGTTGSATVATTGGTPPYTYLWSNGDTSATATGLTAGTHHVTVTDANGCSTEISVLLTDPTGIMATITHTSHVSCFGGNDGSASVMGSGGTPPYTYEWSDDQQQTTADATDLSAGQYIVTVTDDNGCQAIAMAEINQPTALQAEIISVDDTSCDESETGSATVNVTGGTTPYTFAWDTDPVQTSATVTGLGVGTYEVTITDAKECEITTSVSIGSEGSLQIAEVADIGPVCPEEEVSAIMLSATPANSDVVYEWSGGEQVGLDNGTATGINPHIPAFSASEDFGSSEVTLVATLNGCVSTTTFTIDISDNEPPSFVNCPEGQTITVSLFSGDCEGGVNWSIPVATDNCGEPVVTQTAGPEPGSILPVGTYPVEYTATDNAGNTTTCSFVVEVIDTEDPMIVCPDNMMIHDTDSGSCQWTSPDESLKPLLAVANCDFDIDWEVENPDGSLLTGEDDVSGYVFDLGTSTITYTVTEEVSMQTWSCTFTVTVLDTEAPQLTCPSSIEQMTDEEACSATITPVLTTNNVNDNCTAFEELDISYKVTKPDNEISDSFPNGTPFTFPQGISQIEWTVTDASGNMVSCLQQVVIEPMVPVVNAGENDIICEGETYQLDGEASNYESVLWSTNGTGNFVPDANSLDAVYIPGNGDILVEQVQLTLTAFGFDDCPDAQDMMILDIEPQPTANAGPDASICEDTDYLITNASASNYSNVSWTHNGYGQLHNANTLYPTYESHPDDAIIGVVTLTLTAESSGPCSFIDGFDGYAQTIKQGGSRRAARMTMLNVDHPDILEFIRAKQDLSRWQTTNISVG